jgi:hypothetical protein
MCTAGHRSGRLTVGRKFNSTQRYSNSEKISRVKEQFKGRWSSSSEKAVRGGAQEPSEPRRLVGPEEESVQLVPEELSSDLSVII